MPQQIKSSFNQVKVPFQKMSYTPDVPAQALAANEYNQGANVESDVRGIRSVPGDTAIIGTLPFTPVFVTAGFRRNGEYWIVAALTTGNWYATNGTKYQYQSLPAPQEFWYDITPTTITPTGYQQNANITVDWNGTVLFVNDGINAPFVWFDELSTVAIPTVTMTAYSNQVPLAIDTITPATTTTKIIAFTEAQPAAPFAVNSQVVITDVVPNNYNGRWLVTACTATDVTIDCAVTDAYYSGGEVAPLYSWNYNPDWQTVSAGFQRLYNTPNVGSILIAGNLTALTTGSVIEEYPTTVQWSQSFGLNNAPLTWTPTVTNVANQLEIPLRGPAVDGFGAAGQFFISSYWDTVVLSPLNYTTTNAPILGVKIFAKNRGLLSSNAWCDVDGIVYGVDSRDIWVFTGQQFQSIGNQRVKNWFYNQIDPAYYDRIYMVNNSSRQQVEIYYPDSTAVSGVPNKMISYRYDLDIWNAPRDTASATYACETPIWAADEITYTAVPSVSVPVAGVGATFTVVRQGGTYTSVIVDNAGGSGYGIGDTIKILGTDVGGSTPANDLEFTVATLQGPGGSSVATVTLDSSLWRAVGSWTPNLTTRTILYANVAAVPTNCKIVERNRGYTFLNDTAIASVFRRDNIQISKDFSNKIMIHRILPEAVNVGAEPFTATDETQIIPSPGSIDITIEGADSVGSQPASTTAITVELDTTEPWAQINQNAHRVNSIEISDTSTTECWYLSAVSWQFTTVEDDR